VAFIFYIAIFGLRARVLAPGSDLPHKKLVVFFSILFDWVRYECWQIAYFLFTFKYWVISVEMPKAINNTQIKNAPALMEQLNGNNVNNTLSSSEEQIQRASVPV